MRLCLSGQEIKDLAQYAGFVVSEFGPSDGDLLEYEYTVTHAPKTPVQGDDGAVHHYSHLVTCDGCDGNECSPLGEPING